MNKNSWVTRLQSVNIPDKIFNFNIEFTKDRLNEESLLNVDVAIYERFDDFMTNVFGDKQKAQSILGTVNYDIIKFQLMDLALNSCIESLIHLWNSNLKALEFSKDQDLNLYFTMIKMKSVAPLTGREEVRFYKIFGMNLPQWETKDGYISYHSLGGAMSPAQDIIFVDTTGCDDTTSLFHEIFHAMIRELRSTLDNEMYGSTEADVREEICTHFVTDRMLMLSKLHNDIGHLNLVKNNNKQVISVKFNENSKVTMTKVNNCSGYKATSQLKSFTSKCRSVNCVNKVEILNLKNCLKEKISDITTNRIIRSELLNHVKLMGEKSHLYRFMRK